MSETKIMNEILIALGSLKGIRLWRNQTGCLKNEHGRLIRFGLVGSADIIGVLAPSGRFVAIEVKTDTGRQSEAQRNFQRMIEDHGGVYILARSVDDAVRGIEAL